MAEHEHERTERQQDAFTFMGLVTTYQQIAWVALGKVANPATRKVERELEQARWAIDVLAMLERRTRGNLTNAEERMLRETVHILRMNYVEEANRPPEPAEREAAAQAAATPEPEKRSEPDSTPDPASPGEGGS